jgi:hypothetical protein
MDATLKTQVEELARETGGLFVEEFGEPLDSAKTDWDEGLPRGRPYSQSDGWAEA